MTVKEALQAVRHAYTVKKQLLQPDAAQKIILVLMRPRVHHILVFRHDNVPVNNLTAGNLDNNFVVADIEVGGSRAIIGNTSTGTGHLVDLPAYENDVLNALARTGGFPGTNAADALLIYRGYFKTKQERALAVQQFQSLRPGCRPPWPAGPNGQILRIPLRLGPGEEPAFRPEDVVLQTGDVVFLEARPLELFYTAGLLPPGEHILPRDFDLDVVQAVIRVRGPLVNGAFGGSNLSGALIARGVGNPNPSLLTVLRKTPGGGEVPIRVDLNRALCDARERILIQPGDVLILQETPGEAIARYFTEQFNFTAIWRVFTRRDAQGTATIMTP